MANTFTFTDLEKSSLKVLLANKMQIFEYNYTTLIKTIFEGRKKILFASYGFKGGFIKGWHKTNPYTDSREIILIGEKTRNATGQLMQDFSEYETFLGIYKVINDGKYISAGISLEEYMKVKKKNGRSY